MRTLSSLVLLSLIYISIPTLQAATISVPMPARVPLGAISLEYCDPQGYKALSGKQLIMDVTPETDTPRCIRRFNKSPKDARVHVNFVDGSITADAAQHKACKQNGDTVLFGQYIYPATIGGVYIPANKTSIYTGVARFPKTHIGDILGCVTYSIDDGLGIQTGVINIVVRKADFMIAHISGTVASSIYMSGDIQTTYIPSTQTYRHTISLINTGTIGQEVRITHHVTDTLLSTVYIGTGRSDQNIFIMPGETSEVTFETSSIPRYSMHHTVSISYISTPKIILAGPATDFLKNTRLTGEVHSVYRVMNMRVVGCVGGLCTLILYYIIYIYRRRAIRKADEALGGKVYRG